MKDSLTHQVLVELQESRVVREQVVPLLQLLVDSLLELWQQLLKGLLHRVALTDLRGQ